MLHVTLRTVIHVIIHRYKLPIIWIFFVDALLSIQILCWFCHVEQTAQINKVTWKCHPCWYCLYSHYWCKWYKINSSQLTMIFVCRSKYFCLLSDSGRHWHPPSHPSPPVHKNGTFTMFILHKLLIFIHNIIPNEYTFKLCSIFHHFPWWLHGIEHPMYS